MGLETGNGMGWLIKVVGRIRVCLPVLVTATGLLGCVGKTPEALLTEAEGYAAQRDHRTAAIVLRTLLQEEPDNRRAVLLLAKVALAGNNPALAERNFRRAAELGVPESQLWEGRMESLLGLGRYADALAETRTAAGPRTFATPRDAARQALFQGIALLGLQKYGAAEEALGVSLKTLPTADAQLARANLFLSTNRASAADEAVVAALLLEPENPEALLMQGISRLMGGDSGAAAPLLLKALERGRARHEFRVVSAALGALVELDLSTHQVARSSSRIEALVKLVGEPPEVRYLKARVALEQRNFERAKYELQEILAVEKNFAPAQRLLGAIYTLESQFTLAEMFLRPVVLAYPEDLFARRLLASVRLALNRPAEALPLLDGAPGLNAQSRAALLALQGQANLQLGAVAEAVLLFQKGRVEYPENPLFELGLGLTLLAEGRTDEAEKILRQVRGPVEDANREALLIIVALQKGQNREALASARLLVEKSPDQAWSHNLLATVLIALGRFTESRAAVVAALKRNPKDVAALAILARVEELLGQPAAALVAWRTLLNKNPLDTDAAFGVARAQVDQGNSALALEVLAPFQTSSSQAQLMQAGILLNQGGVDAARTLVLKIAQEEPNNAEVWNLLGLTDLVAGAPVDGVINFQKALVLAPASALYRVNLARAYLLAGKDGPAAATLAEARQLAPDLPQLRTLEFLRFVQRGEIAQARQVWVSLGLKNARNQFLSLTMEAGLRAAERQPAAAAALYAQAYRQRPSLDLALRVWENRPQGRGTGDLSLLLDWQKRQPDDPRTDRALASAYLADKQGAKAEVLYEKLLARSPLDLDALNNLAWLYQSRGDQRAVALSQRARQLGPGNPSVLDTAGWIQLRLGDPRLGLSLLQQAARLAPANPDIQYHLAAALVESGQVGAGKKVLGALLPAGGGFASRAAAEQLFRTL